MPQPRLTKPTQAARTPLMQAIKQGQRQGRSASRTGRKALGAATMLLGGAVALSGCISVNAPDKPIVIELNINIKQEVIYRLAADAGNTIESNPDIF